MRKVSRPAPEAGKPVGERRRAIGGISVALLLSVTGCAGMTKTDNERFQAVVARNASPGTSFVTAIENFLRAGFSCDDRSSAPAVTCERNRYSILPFTCIQRAELITDSDRKTVVSATAKPIICASL
jgi:hypothetical protein